MTDERWQAGSSDEHLGDHPVAVRVRLHRSLWFAAAQEPQ